jgi:GT2 family glycosyltransferase
MIDSFSVSGSLVVYKNDPAMLEQLLDSFHHIPLKTNLVVIDNSPTPDLKAIFNKDSSVHYYHMSGINHGFSKAHNIAFSKTRSSRYHLVLNPDIYFDGQIVLDLVKFMEENLSVGLVQPKILFPDGRLQYLCKRNPTILALFLRRFAPKSLDLLVKNYNDWYEMRESGYNKIMDVPYLSGCFMLFRKAYLDEIGYFDENIFMYLEDADITIRMAQNYRSVFYPYVSIYHHWARGSHHSLRLTLITIQSAIYFFNKYGWRLY